MALRQLDLFGPSTSRGDPPKPERYELDATSWVMHTPGWLSGPDELFAALTAHAGWEQRNRWMFTKSVSEPRLTAEFPILAEAPVLEVRRIGERLSKAHGVLYDSAWLNLYRDENDSTAWHADRAASRPSTSVVPVLSLGATRRFLVRPTDGGHRVTFVVAAGDLVIMGGRCQRDWEHAVPKERTRAGARISVNFGSSSQNAKEG
jgi:alkylated DNA repair dioxygenase AlkB